MKKFKIVEMVVMLKMSEMCTLQNTHPDLDEYATAMHAAKVSTWF